MGSVCLSLLRSLCYSKRSAPKGLREKSRDAVVPYTRKRSPATERGAVNHSDLHFHCVLPHEADILIS